LIMNNASTRFALDVSVKEVVDPPQFTPPVQGRTKRVSSFSSV